MHLLAQLFLLLSLKMNVKLFLSPPNQTSGPVPTSALSLVRNICLYCGKVFLVSDKRRGNADAASRQSGIERIIPGSAGKHRPQRTAFSARTAQVGNEAVRCNAICAEEKAALRQANVRNLPPGRENLSHPPLQGKSTVVKKVKIIKNVLRSHLDTFDGREQNMLAFSAVA